MQSQIEQCKVSIKSRYLITYAKYKTSVWVTADLELVKNTQYKIYDFTE